MRMNAKYCPQCSTGYDLSKKFCGKCGSQLSTNIEGLSDEDLDQIVTEDFTLYSPDEVKAAVEELKKRDWEIGSDVSEAIDEYVSVANLSDEKLIEVVENFWNYPTSMLELVYKELEKRKIKIDEKIFEDGVMDGSDTEEDS